MPTKPDYLDQLIERASDAAGSDYKLAKMLDVPRQNLSAWKHGRKTCPAGDQVLMAQIAGLKPEEWAARAIVAQYEGTSKGDMLFRALGKELLATGAAVASSGASALAIYSPRTMDTIKVLLDTMYRNVKKRAPFLNVMLSNA